MKGRVCVEEAEVKPTLSRGLGEFVQTPVFSPFVYPDAVPKQKREVSARRQVVGVITFVKVFGNRVRVNLAT